MKWKTNTRKRMINAVMWWLSYTHWNGMMRRVLPLHGIPFITPVWSWEKHETNSDGRHSIAYLVSTPQGCEGHENKGKLRKCHGLAETGKTWQLNTVWYAGLNSVPNKDINEKTVKIKKVWSLIRQCQCLIFDKMYHSNTGC